MTGNAYTLEQAELEINGIYKWFAQHSPGTVVQEAGHLADLWSIVDYYYALEEL